LKFCFTFCWIDYKALTYLFLDDAKMHG